MEKCHMATSWKVKRSQCFYSRKELAARYQSCYKLVPQQAQHPSEENHTLQERHFRKKVQRGRWHYHLLQPASWRESISNLPYKISPLKSTRDPSRHRKLGNKGWPFDPTLLKCHVVQTIPVTAVMALYKRKMKQQFSKHLLALKLQYSLLAAIQSRKEWPNFSGQLRNNPDPSSLFLDHWEVGSCCTMTMYNFLIGKWLTREQIFLMTFKKGEKRKRGRNDTKLCTCFTLSLQCRKHIHKD